MAQPLCVNEYYLKELAPSLFNKEIKIFEVKNFLRFTTVLKLTKVSPDHIKSKHAVIAISGFLTEDVDKRESWRPVWSHFN